MSAKIMGQVFDYVTTASEQAVLLALADHAEHDGSNAFPSVDLLAWKTGMSERGVQGILARLRRGGVLLEQRVAGYHRPRTYRIVLGALVHKPLFERKGERRAPMKGEAAAPMKGEPGDEKGAGDGSGRVHGDALMGARIGAPEPSVEPSSETSKNLPRAARAPAIEIPSKVPSEREIEREQHRFGKEAERVWTETAAKVGSPYTDRQALRVVHEQAIGATRWGSDAAVLAAIRRRMDHKSSPRRIPEWVRLEAADVAEREHATRAREHRDEVIEPRPGGLRHIGGAAAAIATPLARV